MNDKVLVETAVLAGEIMLVSGAEIYRVEDTMNRILRKAHRQTSEAVVLTTGIFVTLNDPRIEAITVTRRVTKRASNLNRVYLANDVSRQLCADQITVEEAYESLLQISEQNQYKPWLKSLGTVGTSAFFCLLLGGNAIDCMAAALVGAFLAVISYLETKIRLNDFCKNAVGAFAVAIAALCLNRWVWPDAHRDSIIIGAIMPLVPGVIFTTAIRDTLNGDYSSGAARILEAVVIALAVAAGVGAGMAVFYQAAGGIGVW